MNLLKRLFVCSIRGHRFKFGPRCCIRCGAPLRGSG
jgi:hypothetical protein